MRIHPVCCRAVKLNGVDVVKILCQLASRKGISLSSASMREPESSATVLHVALLYNHEAIVEYLVSLNDRDLVLATYTNAEYRNQTALHVAVANDNHRLVDRLLNALGSRDRKRVINTVATGTYFQRKHVDGQLCVTAAVWSGNERMLLTLAAHGANFGLRNLRGETLLHRVVEASASHPNRMDYASMLNTTVRGVGVWASRCRYKTNIAAQKELEQTEKQLSTIQKLLNMRNHDGQTPLAVAAHKGCNMLADMMNLEKIYKIPQTRLGSISWVTYDVTDITTFAHKSYNKFSVLHILAHHSDKLARHANLNTDPSHSFLDIEPIKSLIEMKWAVYRWIYIIWCLLHLAHIILFTYFTYDVNTCGNEAVGEGYRQQPVTYSLAVFLLLPVLYLLLEGIDLLGHCPYSICHMRHQPLFTKLIKRLKSEWVITGNGPYRLVMVGFSVFSTAWYALYMQRHYDQDIALSMSLLLGWIFVLFFTRGCRVVSRFSIMIQKMFFRDLMYFLAVYVVILIGFSFAVNAMYAQFHIGDPMLHVSIRWFFLYVVGESFLVCGNYLSI